VWRQRVDQATGIVTPLVLLFALTAGVSGPGLNDVAALSGVSVYIRLQAYCYIQLLQLTQWRLLLAADCMALMQVCLVLIVWH
jgi:hypothetical protein